MAKSTKTTDEKVIDQIQSYADDLEEIAWIIGDRFSRTEARERAIKYIQMLMSPIERKNGWQMAEEAGDKTPYAMQHLLGRAVWDADEVRDDLRKYVVENLGDGKGVLVIDETGFVKKGVKSAGVQRQYSGTAGRVENCQIGVFLAYATQRGRTFLDRELYIPKSWIEDKDRMEEAGVSSETEFATKLVLARRMLERAVESGVEFQWVTGDEVYGSDSQLRGWLEKRQINYVLAVSSQYQVWYKDARRWVSEIAQSLPKKSWKRLSAGAGTKGERLYDWAILRLGKPDEQHQKWLLYRRSISDPTEISYYVVCGNKGTKIEDMVKVAGTRWAIEETFETAKGEVGLDHYEVRNWDGWYRHITLAMFAHAYLTVLRSRSVLTEEISKKRKR